MLEVAHRNLDDAILDIRDKQATRQNFFMTGKVPVPNGGRARIVFIPDEDGDFDIRGITASVVAPSDIHGRRINEDYANTIFPFAQFKLGAWIYGFAANDTNNGRFSLSAILPGSFINGYTLTITDTVLAGAETVTWGATTLVIAVEAGVSTVAQVLAAVPVGTPWATLAQTVAGAVDALGATVFSALPQYIAGVDASLNSAYAERGLICRIYDGKNDHTLSDPQPDMSLSANVGVAGSSFPPATFDFFNHLLDVKNIFQPGYRPGAFQQPVPFRYYLPRENKLVFEFQNLDTAVKSDPDDGSSLIEYHTVTIVLSGRKVEVGTK